MMSTRAVIAMQLPDETVIATYLHFDGYPDRVMPILSPYRTRTCDRAVNSWLGDIGHSSTICWASGLTGHGRDLAVRALGDAGTRCEAGNACR